MPGRDAFAAAGCLDDLHRFDVATGAWRELSPPSGGGGVWPTARGGHGFAAVGPYLYLFGGAFDNGALCNLKAETQKPFQNSVRVRSMRGCADPSLACRGAGYSFDVPHSPALNDLVRFDTSSGNWTDLTPFPRPNQWPAERCGARL